MKATLQVLAATLALAAVGLSVWFAVERGDGEHAPERAPVSALEPGAGETDALPRIEIEAPLAALSERAVVPSEHHEAPVAPEAAHEARVAGRCVDDALLPLANVRISQADPARPNAARSAGDGRFSLLVEPSVLHDAVLRFELAGKATRLVKLTLQAGASEELGDVRLEPGDVLRGLVLGPDGRPFPEALVSVTSPELYGSLEEAETRGPLAADLVAHSGPDGRFEVSGVPLTPVRAWASAEGMRHAISTPLRVQEAPPELVLTLEPLRREDRLRGIVLTPTGEPVPGARLSIVARGGGGYSMYDEHADDAGRFDLEAEPGKAYDLGAHDPLDRFAEVQALGLAPGARDIELVFEPAQFIEVEVRARDGGALERFALAADPLDASGDVLRRAQEEEHPGGTARLRARTRAFLVQVEARGFAPARQGPFPPDALPARLRFELEPAPGVRGRVLADGHPLAGARVSLHDASPGLYIQSQGFESTRNRYAEDKTTTDAQGRFVLQLHDTGTFVVRAEADGFAPGDAGPLTLDSRAGHELELVLVRGGALEGRVHLAPGHDPEGFIVGLNRGDGFPHTVRADADGHFRFEGLMSGPWQLARATSEFNPEQSGGAYATRADWALPTNVIVVAGETVHADLDLSDLVPGVLDGRLTVNGSPATDWVVRAWPRGVSAFSGTLPTSALDADGRFHFEFEEPGARRLSFTPAPELGLDGTIDLEAEVRAGNNSWSFDLACGEVAGRCPPLAQGVELALCSPRDSSASFQLTLRPDSNDRYFVPYVPAGPVELHRYSWPDGQYRDELLGELVVRAGAAHTLDLP